MPLFNWKNIRIDGMGFVTHLVISHVKSEGNTIFCATDVGGGYRFNRQTRVWTRFPDNIPTSEFGDGGVDSLAMDGSRTATKNKAIYIAVKYRYGTAPDGNTAYHAAEVLKSTNKGISWTSTGLGVNQLDIEPNSYQFRNIIGERLAVDPNKPDILYYGSYRGGLWKKVGTAPWARVTGGGLPDYTTFAGNSWGFTFVAFDRTSGTAGTPTPVIYVGAYSDGIYKSTDAGATWIKITGTNTFPHRGTVGINGDFYGILYDQQVRVARASTTATPLSINGFNSISNICTHPTNSTTLIAIDFDKRLFVSQNAGASWTTHLLSTGAYDANYPDAIVNPSAPGYYQAYSADLGCCIAIDPLFPSRVWWTNGWGVARIDNYATTPVFTWEMNGLEELDTNLVRCPPKPVANGGALCIVGNQDKIGFRITDLNTPPSKQISPVGVPTNPAYAGLNQGWTTYPVPFPHVAGAGGIDYCYQQPDHVVFVGWHQWQFWPIHGKSSDNGDTWQAFPSVPVQNYWNSDTIQLEPVQAQSGVVAIASNNPQNMVWMPTNLHAHYTTDGGATWQQCKLANPGTAPDPIDPTNQDSLYWDNPPRNFAHSISPWISQPGMLCADRQQSGTFYYFDVFDLYVSTNGGATWAKRTRQLPSFSTNPCMIVNPLVAGQIWFCNRRSNLQNFGLYRSNDFGVSFTQINTVDTAQLIAFGRGINATTPALYMFGRVGGATQDTMYKSEDLGVTWQQISSPSVQAFCNINFLEADMRQENIVYASVAGRGFMYGVPAV